MYDKISHLIDCNIRRFKNTLLSIGAWVGELLLVSTLHSSVPLCPQSTHNISWKICTIWQWTLSNATLANTPVMFSTGTNPPSTSQSVTRKATKLKCT